MAGAAAETALGQGVHPPGADREAPTSDRACRQWCRQIAADGAWLLEQVDTDPAVTWLARLLTVQALRTIWGQECVADDAGTWHLRTTRIDPETCDDDLIHLIVAVHTTRATEPEIPALADVHTRLATSHATPGEHYLDQGYVTAEAICTAQADEIEIVGRRSAGGG
jgi:hypothetical protein